jgi:hypothetical protein
MRTMSGFRETELTAYCSKMTQRTAQARRTHLLATAFGIAIGLYALQTRPAHAADPNMYLSEIITPAGWELQVTAKACWWERERTSPELVTPKGWDDASSREMLTWSGCVCSDLVEPAEWHRMRAANELRGR